MEVEINILVYHGSFGEPWYGDKTINKITYGLNTLDNEKTLGTPPDLLQLANTY